MSPLLLLLAVLPAVVTAASPTSMERMPRVIHDPCLSVGHWVHFDTSKCGEESSSLMPVVLSQDGKTRLVPEQGQPTKICVQPMHFSGHAFLEAAGLGDWQDPLLQYVNFTFKAFPDATHVHKASYVEADVGPDGGEDLQTTGESPDLYLLVIDVDWPTASSSTLYLWCVLVDGQERRSLVAKQPSRLHRHGHKVV